ncbi:hypothetical protein NPIL_13071 [Nephila pilipes]|uniref:Uncharacterized protein n=1 Tax=Nephila pilipes TaxID=299642 RepID=A0A8X6QHM4_NEPPI|nr:hypothetical protein NPIL_13071 [Nephila pilipes]
MVAPVCYTHGLSDILKLSGEVSQFFTMAVFLVYQDMGYQNRRSDGRMSILKAEMMEKAPLLKMCRNRLLLYNLVFRARVPVQHFILVRHWGQKVFTPGSLPPLLKQDYL